jgi:hypothetical protein
MVMVLVVVIVVSSIVIHLQKCEKAAIPDCEKVLVKHMQLEINNKKTIILP